MIWAFLAAIAALVVAALLWPVLRKGSQPKDRVAYDLAVFQDQLTEVERDIARGVLTPTEAQAARLEIQRRILAVSKAPAELHNAESPRGRALFAGGLAVTVPALAFAIYFAVGTPNLSGAAGNGAGTPSEKEIVELVEKLAAKVAANPSDAEGVNLLARTYRQLGRWDDAVKSFQQLVGLKPDAENYASYGEVLTAANKGEINQAAHDALIKALTLDRGEPRSRFYLGLEQSQKGNAKDAIAIWRDLSAAAPSDAPWLTMVREELARVAQEASIPPMTVEPKHPFALAENASAAAAAAAAAISAPPVARAPSPDASPLSAQYSPEQLTMIKGMVGGLAERLEKSPDDYDGWLMLGRSYAVLQNMAGASKAYEKAIALKPTEVDPKLQYVALIMTVTNPDAQAPLPPALTATVSDILKLNPAQPEALYLAGLDRAKSGDKAGARDFWAKASNVMPDGTALKADIARRVQALD